MNAALVLRLQRNGIKVPRIAYATAKNAELELAVMCAILMMETGGGRNVYGHDPVRNPIKSPPSGSLTVTEANYRVYRHYRVLGYGMQGVGTTQLTWYTYQDLADRYGGCWKPGPNMRVSAEHMRASIQRYGLWGSFRAYNGSGPAATAYANRAVALVQHFRWVIGGAKFNSLASPEWNDGPGGAIHWPTMPPSVIGFGLTPDDQLDRALPPTDELVHSGNPLANFTRGH